MGEYRKIDYTQVALPEELLTSFAKAMLPELRKFYASDEGRAYFAKWLLKHPEYAAHSTPERADDYNKKSERRILYECSHLRPLFQPQPDGAVH